MNNSKKELAKDLFQIFYLDNKVYSLDIKEINSAIVKVKEEIRVKKQELQKLQNNQNDISKNTEIVKSEKESKEKLFKETEEKYNKIEKVEKLLSVYRTMEDLIKQFQNQTEFEDKKKKLNLFSNYLSENSYMHEFQKTKFFETDFYSASMFYSEQKIRLITEIENLSKLKCLFEDTYTEKSFAFWFRNNITKLTKEQEEILFHFRDKAIEKPETKKTSLNLRYIPEPQTIFTNIKIEEQEENGFWINLGGVSEFIENRAKEDLIFNNPETIENELIKFGQNIKEQISEKEKELETIQRTLDIVTGYKAFNEEICTIFKEKISISNFFTNPDLKIHEEEFNKLIEFYNGSEVGTIKENYNCTKLDYEASTQKLLNHNTEVEKNENSISGLTEIIKHLEQSLTESEKPDSELSDLIDKQKKNENSIKIWNEKIQILESSWYQNKVKVEFENPLSDAEKEELIQSIEIKIKEIEEEKKTNTAIKRELNDIVKEERENKGKIENDIDKLLSNQPIVKKDYENAEREYEKYLMTNKKQIKDYKILKRYSEDYINDIKSKSQNAKLKYEANFKSIINDSELSLEEGYKNNLEETFDFNELVNALLPNVVKNIDDVENTLKKDIDIELNSINAKMLDFAGKNLMIIKELFGYVEEQYEKYIDQIKNLEDFFKTNRASGNYYVELKSNPSNNYPIKWIKVLKQKVHTEIFNTGIWKKTDSKTADEIIIETFKEYSNLRTIEPNIRKLLDPKSYFELSIEFKSPTNENAPPSTGQGYAILALLNIAKLSLIDNQFDTKKSNLIPKGIRYMPIDEVAGLGENFDMLYKIAQEYDYQILTMTITANDNEFENDNQYSYTLRKNPNPKDPNRNLKPFAIFTKYNLMESIEPYIKKLKDELRN